MEGHRILGAPADRPPRPSAERCGERVRFVDAEETDEAEIAGRRRSRGASPPTGSRPAPGRCIRALAAGAVPLASRLPVYEEVLGEGERGLEFEPGDVETLAAQLRAPDRASPSCAQAAARARSAAARFTWARVVDELEGIYADAGRAAPRRSRRRAHADAGSQRARADRRRPAHAHRPLVRLRDPGRGAAAEAESRGLGAIAVTDHNEISGALEAQAKADGIKVIVGEEVKTASQGEVIGLFIDEKIPRGLTLQETIAEIQRQGGLVYVPHPFDRLHAVPDYEHLLGVLDAGRRDRGLQPARGDQRVQRGGGPLCRQVPDPGGRRVGRARAAGARLGANPHARLRRPRGVSRVAARRRHRPQAGQPALRPGAEVPADQGFASPGTRDALQGPPRAPGHRRDPRKS